MSNDAKDRAVGFVMVAGAVLFYYVCWQMTQALWEVIP